ncbi:hypothetical protein [Subtercola sp. RTI3]|uniref:hypothetical protein n=1 Tax=Subtercola sp. RTI3 TaxID=3048639 RepID=UPI002B23252F|nr:hypothetical protein [Subtercola sp. RTI3]MEA9986301.1 hypothetical protein [Subtercola sp. RTI3]
MTLASATSPVPEIWFKAKRVLRTLVQVGIPAFLAFALVLPQILAVSGIPVSSELYLWLISVAAGITAVAGGLSRVMAIPAVNTWLVNIGLGSVPGSAITNLNLPVTPMDATIVTSPEAGAPPADIDPTPAAADYEAKHVNLGD